MYKIPHVSGWQVEYLPYNDCYGKYKYAKRDTQGYVKLCLNKDHIVGEDDTIYRHRWVYMNEKKDIPKGYVINHLNRIRGDDHPDNLEMLTKSAHSKKHVHEQKSGRIPIGVPFL